MPTNPLPDDLAEAIGRAARQVKRRHDSAAWPDPDGPQPRDDLDSFVEDIENELEVPLAKVVAERDRLWDVLDRMSRMHRCGMYEAAERLLEITMRDLDKPRGP